MSIQLTILGYNSATPKVDSHPTAQLLNVNERFILIDCGEGTQVQLRRARAKFSKINHIFISHLHGDHVFGLIGFISTMQLMGKITPLNIFGPEGIKDFILNQLKHTQSKCSYEIIFHELSHKDSRLIFEDNKLEVYNIPLDHRIYCNGYLVKEKPRLKNLNIEAIQAYPEIETCDYFNLKKGKDFVLSSGEIIPNDILTFPQEEPLSYAFCSDTRYKEDLVDIIKGVDLLYHETTFDKSLGELAYKTGHATAEQAAIIAKKAEVGKLIMGHFSNRYTDLNILLSEAREIFPESYLPKNLEIVEVKRN